MPRFLKKYYRHDEINDYLDNLSDDYKNLVSIEIVGHTYEGRQIKSITISVKNTKKKKNSVLIDAGAHAREWISISVALYCIYQLVEKNKLYLNLLEQIDIVIIPVVNPDGYEYTHEKNRFWRKTRKPINGYKTCIGTDCNRNYDHHWKDAPNNPCRCTFRGEKPFSEPETVAVRNVMESLKPNCKFYLSLHSHAQALLYPWGYTKQLPERWKSLHILAKTGSNAIEKATGRHYRYGNTSSLIRSKAAGGSPDYAYGVQNIPFTITMELPAGGTGFDPPEKEIKSIVEESFIGILAMMEYVVQYYITGVKQTCVKKTKKTTKCCSVMI